PWAVDTVAVELLRARLGQIAVPHLIGVLRQYDTRLLMLAGTVEQAQFDLFRMRRKQREIDPLAVPGGAERGRPTGPYGGRGHQRGLTGPNNGGGATVRRLARSAALPDLSG